MAYYIEKLSGEPLKQVYEVAPPRVKQYLRAEIEHLISRLNPTGHVLELGCGTGRVAFALAPNVARITGIDNAPLNIKLGAQLAAELTNCTLLLMDATMLAFPVGTFDAVVCVQNGICAFGVDQALLLREALRVTKPGGRLLFSTYAEEFWHHRLAWFQAQAAAGLMGEVDLEASGDGVIVCRDGFRAGLMRPQEFTQLFASQGLQPTLHLVDHSCLFCEAEKPGT